MKVLVDTPVWSEFYRRAVPHQETHKAFRALVEAGEATILGPIRQEILSGLKDQRQFERLRTVLRSFRDGETVPIDFEYAASLCNQCRSHGIQGSNTDFLICAVSIRLSAPIFTLDRDFEEYARILPIRLYRPTSSEE